MNFKIIKKNSLYEFQNYNMRFQQKLYEFQNHQEFKKKTLDDLKKTLDDEKTLDGHKIVKKSFTFTNKIIFFYSSIRSKISLFTKKDIEAFI